MVLTSDGGDGGGGDGGDGHVGGEWYVVRCEIRTDA